MNLKFVSADKVVMKDDNLCQTLGQFTGVHFYDLNPNCYDISNIKKFDLNVSTKVKVKVFPKLFALRLLKNTYLCMHRNETFCIWAVIIYLLWLFPYIQDLSKW